MHSLLILMFLAILSACASRTSVSNTNENIQTAMTLGTNKISEAYNSTRSDDSKTVVVSIKGEVVITPTCALNGNYVIEIKRSIKDAKSVAWGVVKRSSPMTYTIDEKIAPDEYIIYLLRTKDSKIIQTKTVRIDANNDRHTVNFDGCP